MSATAPAATHLSAYHRGQARLFLQRMTTDHAEWVVPLNRIRRDAIATLRRRQGKPPRPEMLTDIERAWRQLPTTGQLYPLHIIRERHRFEVLDVRCIPELLHKLGGNWAEDDSEPALVLGAYSLAINRSNASCRASMETAVLASVCLHAIGRRLERSSCVSDSAITADLFTLVDYAARNLTQPRGPFTAPLVEGSWKGERDAFVVPAGQRFECVHHARTYVDR